MVVLERSFRVARNFSYDSVFFLSHHAPDVLHRVCRYLVLLNDLVAGNFDRGDAFKLYHSFVYHEGVSSAGKVGIGIVAFLYLVHGTFSFCVSYLYFFRLHRNSQVQDLLRRSEALEDEIFMPEDDELSLDELEFICTHCALLQRRRGYTKEVAVAEVAIVDKCLDGDESLCGDESSELLHKVRIFERPTGKRGRARRTLWRQFEVRADGRVIEIFDFVSEGGDVGRLKVTNESRLDEIRSRNIGGA